jgi:hypothetical protein
LISYIERVPITRALEQKLSATGLNHNSLPKTIPSGSGLEIRDLRFAAALRYRASLYAESGLWYDAVQPSQQHSTTSQRCIVQEDFLSLLNPLGGR